MLKKSYLLVAVLSFMFMAPAFSIENEEETSDPLQETPRGHETLPKKEGDLRSSQSEEQETPDPKTASPGQSAEQNISLEDPSKGASPPSAKSSKKRSGWCCFPSRKEIEDDK